ncbi:vWA domain-containing protein [Stieleria varia]|uniref:VWFA domain-containing protein n=1 Tax=Stieleria varia TaxID=2528005 RepID=A0A5C6A581_9BACT|nr:hypothetical protein [Stieleria varia]TWT94458.1 hypothetical protein Pla52n_52790 [Stieleria varia]
MPQPDKIAPQSPASGQRGAAESTVRSHRDLPPDRPPELVIPQRTAPAMILSIAAHVVLLVVMGLVLTQTTHGTGESADRPVGIAMVHRLPDRDRYVEAKPEQQSATDNQQTSNDAAAASAPPADLSPPIDLAGVLAAIEATPAPTSGTGLSGETNLDGDAFGESDGRKSPAAKGEEATTMVFGVSGSGSRFVYVFDRSDSMNGFEGRPLRSAKAELIRSLRTLSPRQQFQIIFYNDQPKPFELSGMALQMVSGESALIRRAERYIQAMTAVGGTEHEAALKMALRMSPDVIFFLTDARIPRLSATQLADIQRRAQQSGTTIHAIEFGSTAVAPPAGFLRELAEQNGGQYQYVDVRQLSREQLRTPPADETERSADEAKQ